MGYVAFQTIFKELQQNQGVSLVEITFLRTGATFLASILLVIICGRNPLKEVKRDYVIPLAARCLAGSCTFILVTKTVHLLPLTIFQLFNMLTPFVTAVVAFMWLRESLAIFQLVAMTFSFGGIVLVILTSPEAKLEIEGSSETGISSYNLGIICVCTVVFLFALSGVTTRRIRDLHYSVIQMYLCMCGFIIGSSWLIIELNRPKGIPNLF